jgi:hypothetical protein
MHAAGTDGVGLEFLDFVFLEAVFLGLVVLHAFEEGVAEHATIPVGILERLTVASELLGDVHAIPATRFEDAKASGVELQLVRERIPDLAFPFDQIP